MVQVGRLAFIVACPTENKKKRMPRYGISFDQGIDARHQVATILSSLK
jgi:hypothetical protein